MSTTVTALRISAEDRKEINRFARAHKGLAIYSHCQIAVRSFEGSDHANLAYFGIREPGTVGASDLADFGPRLADLRSIEGHTSGYVVADFYTYGRDRVGGDLQLDTNVQAVWFRGVLIALSEGSREIEWLVEPEPEAARFHLTHTGIDAGLPICGSETRTAIDQHPSYSQAGLERQLANCCLDCRATWLSCDACLELDRHDVNNCCCICHEEVQS